LMSQPGKGYSAPRECWPVTIPWGDVGVIFSDAAGGRAVLRLCYANKDNAVVEGIAADARLEPHRLTIVQVE